MSFTLCLRIFPADNFINRLTIKQTIAHDKILRLTNALSYATMPHVVKRCLTIGPAKMTRETIIALRVRTDMKEDVKKAAEDEGRSMSQWLERLIASHFQRTKEQTKVSA